MAAPTKPFKPSIGTKFQQGIDSLVGLANPRAQLARMEARAAISTKLHQYAGANTGRSRTPPKSLRSPDSLSGQNDALVMQRRSQDLGRDSAFIGHLANQYRIYALGDISYIPQTGDKKADEAYRTYWGEWMCDADEQGRFHLIDMMQLSLSGVIYNGRHGFIHHHNEDGTFRLQPIMGYNIGNPRTVYTNPHNIQGIRTDSTGRVIGYDLYQLSISGMVRFLETVPASIFSCLNPVTSTDEYSAKTPLHAVLNDAHDMKVIENAWMDKVKWAAFKTAVFNTPNGSPPDGDPNENPLDNSSAGQVTNGRVRHQLPGEELHGEEGFNVEMLKNENPTNNETDLLVTKLAQVASALSLPLPFVWVMMGLPGTYTRLISEQAKRAFQHGPLGQKWLERTALTQIKNKALVSGIIRGKIPWTPNFTSGFFMYPAHPTVDVGRESKANLDENRQGIRSMDTITAEEALYWRDVDEQLGNEAENKIRLAIEKAKNLSEESGEEITWTDVMPFIQSMSANPPPPAQGAEWEIAPRAQGVSPAKKRKVETNFTRLEDKLDKLSTRLADVSSEARDTDGKWTDSGGGSEKKSAKNRTPVKATANRTPAPACDDRCQRAKAAHVMVDKGIQRYAEEHNEPRVAKALGGISFPDGEPIDIAIAGENGVVQHGVELKTVVKNSNGKITMKGDAIARKAKWERKNKAKIHTLVIDDSEVFNANGEGKHDESKRKIYYANGYGSFRIATMHQVKDMAEARALMDTPYKKLPAAAQKR